MHVHVGLHIHAALHSHLPSTKIQTKLFLDKITNVLLRHCYCFTLCLYIEFILQNVSIYNVGLVYVHVLSLHRPCHNPVVI